MELTYDRMNRKLSFAAAVVQGLVLVILAVNLFSSLWFSLPYWRESDMLGYSLENLASHILNLTFAALLFIVLLRAKKDTFAGIVLLLPALSLGVALAYSIVMYIILLFGDDPIFGSYGHDALLLVQFVNTLVFRGILAIACFTKGRIFGQRCKNMLPILAIAYVMIDILQYIFSSVIIILMTSRPVIGFTGPEQVLMMTLQDPITWRGLLIQLPGYAVSILMALAFLHPAKNKTSAPKE